MFINPADIGGRYSALSYFGLVPAALMGADVGALIGAGVEFAAASGAGVPVAESPGVVLGAAIGAAAKAGRDKLTLVISPDIASFGSWIEQLVAESSGKEGKGIVPVDLEPVGAPEQLRRRSASSSTSGRRRPTPRRTRPSPRWSSAGQPVVRIAVDGREALGREIFRWEMATAIACAVLGVNPFDEPNVTEAKVATSALLAAARGRGQAARRPDDTCEVARRRAASARTWRRRRRPTTSRFCAYFLRTPARDALLTRMRVACRDRTRNATTVGYGPRFLHSTGQLHKGGPNTGVFLQLTADAPADLPVPGEATPSRPCATRRRSAICRCSSAAAGARCASTWAPTSTPASRRWPTRLPAKRRAAPASRRRPMLEDQQRRRHRRCCPTRCARGWPRSASPSRR